MGLELLEIPGQELEALAIEYAGGEVLRLPVYRLDLVDVGLVSQKTLSHHLSTVSGGNAGKQCAIRPRALLKK
ncbi:MAG: hypothetical protein CM1200mP14_15610 [Gammaproteobacteria bacterium]|nr:MAG: hypothetical protein CM1200mP14_15610 [Gammaproteobacteria bacterium]